GGNLDDGIGANRTRQFLVELLNEVLVRISLLRLDGVAEKQIGKRQQRVGIAVARPKAQFPERGDDSVAIRREDRKRQSHDAVAKCGREILCQAEIEQHYFGAGLNEDVAGMR